jgi:hypothetical protein
MHGRARTIVPLLLLLLSTRALADGPTSARAPFPDRRFDAVTAGDAGLAGSGLATDPVSSLYANPALALEGNKSLRFSGLLLQSNRDDLRATTTNFADASGFPAVGEVGARLRYKGVGISAYYSQPHYEHEENQFVGVDPGTGDVTGDPFQRKNEWTSATRYAGLGAALRLANGLVLGAAAEGVFLKERWVSTPQVPPNTIPADSFDTNQSATVFGGALGASYNAGGLVRVAAAYHFAGDVTYDDGGTDQAPKFGVAGVRVGRTAGPIGTLGVRFLSERDVDLADPPTPHHADARTEYALGFNYLDPSGMWDLRIGGAMSPRPSDDAIKYSKFGVAVGGGTEDAKVLLAYERTSENRPNDRSSARNLIALSVEVIP